MHRLLIAPTSACSSRSEDKGRRRLGVGVGVGLVGGWAAAGAALVEADLATVEGGWATAEGGSVIASVDKAEAEAEAMVSGEVEEVGALPGRCSFAAPHGCQTKSPRRQSPRNSYPPLGLQSRMAW
jgi:hypothetical protein